MTALLPRSAWGLRTTSFVVLLLLWQLAAMLYADPLLPGPGLVLARIGEEAFQGELFGHLGITLARVVLSFAAAMLIGTVIGIIMGNWRSVDLLLDAWLVIGLNIPALVTIILCYLWIGLSDLAAIVAVAINKIPTVVVMVREGSRAIDRELLAVARVFRLNRRRTLFKVYLPQLYPYLMAGARSGLSLIWKIVLVVELLGRSDGIGFQLGIFFQFFDITGIIAYTVVFAAVVLLVEALVMRPLERRLNAWRL
jgi:ABC-type nitrate/sulfonate/bicarbonate transport system permease component